MKYGHVKRAEDDIWTPRITNNRERGVGGGGEGEGRLGDTGEINKAIVREYIRTGTGKIEKIETT